MGAVNVTIGPLVFDQADYYSAGDVLTKRSSPGRTASHAGDTPGLPRTTAAQ